MNLADLVAARAAAVPDHPALIHAGGVWTYRELLCKADAVAAGLLQLARGASVRIALFCPNGPEYVALAVGVLRANMCLVPIPSELAVAERTALLTLTAPRGVVIAGTKAWLPSPGVRQTCGGIEFTWIGLTGEAAFPEDRFAAFRPAFVRFSSGTTGSSKGVVIGQDALLARIRSANRRLRLTPEDRVLWTLAMAHHFPVSILLYLVEGATIVLENSHLAEDLLTAARASGATVFYGSPFHLALLAAEESGRDWPTLRLAIGTAAAVPERTSVDFGRRYGQPPAQGFGIIEAGLPLLNTADPAHRPDSVGVPDDFEVSLRDDSGREVRNGEIGELWLRGPGMFDAYLSPWIEQVEAAPDGWFATGDLAQRDPDGFVYLRGRCKSVINFGGLKFFPEEVEAVLNAHPRVRDSRVAGEPHERWGAVAVAEIVPRDPAEPPESTELMRHCREQLAAYKVPVRFRTVVEISRTASGKIRR